MGWSSHGGENARRSVSGFHSVVGSYDEVDYRMAEYGDFDVERIVEIARAIRPDDYESVAELSTIGTTPSTKLGGCVFAGWFRSMARSSARRTSASPPGSHSPP